MSILLTPILYFSSNTALQLLSSLPQHTFYSFTHSKPPSITIQSMNCLKATDDMSEAESDNFHVPILHNITVAKSADESKIDYLLLLRYLIWVPDTYF